jgi:hypothetical protein
LATIIIEDTNILNLEKIFELLEYLDNSEFEIFTTQQLPYSPEELNELHQLMQLEEYRCPEFYIEPAKYDDIEYLEPEPRTYHLKNNQIYKNNITIKPIPHLRCNTSHSGWIGRKGYKKRKGK